jgi:hypothetical protein
MRHNKERKKDIVFYKQELIKKKERYFNKINK